MIILDLKDNMTEVVSRALHIIQNGGIVILPFDTVYGFVCDPKNEQALQKIYDLKKRPSQKTIGLATANIELLSSIAEINSYTKKYILERTPGRYTFILNVINEAPISNFCVQNNTVGIRIPDSKLILNIAKECGNIVAQTSANVSGQPNCFSLNDIEKQFDKSSLAQVDLIVDGGKLENIGPSKLIDLTGSSPQNIERK